MGEGWIDIAMKAYKNNPKLDTSSDGLAWLRVPLQRALDAVEQHIRAAEKERLLEQWAQDSHAVRFNKAHDDLTPHQRYAKWLKEA